jgi:CRISPR-associated endonuclease/helicase Cas3
MEFAEFFKQATTYDPYPYQTELATADPMPELLDIPTGLGKTAGAILAWLWRRRFADKEIQAKTPRRLVYCLPMRVLVEQTHSCAVSWLHNLGLLGGRRGAGPDRVYDPQSGDDDPKKIRVHMLMGGDLDRDWDMYPELDAILIGTQDMLLSRALNRGYAMSRFRWPVQFGLLNNDCLWVMDEVQLMGNGLAATAQLQAFRRQMGTIAKTRSLWMSATMRPEWLATVDFDASLDARGHLEIGDDDKCRPELKPRFEAVKRLEPASFEVTPEGNAEADLVMKRHANRTRTLVVVNTVKRAQAIYHALKRRKPEAELVLVHSRFRPKERKANLDRLLAEPGQHGTIGVCTQVVEAGVDVSARTLITDLAPWASMVQRFGRCNRKGEYKESNNAAVVWIAPENLDDVEKLKSAPYAPEELRAAAARLEGMDDVGPRSLPPVTESMAFSHVIRRKDVIDLFDTTPDLAGADVDVSRFIRETDSHDVHVFWRDIAADSSPSPANSDPARNEFCPVPVGEFRDWLKKPNRKGQRRRAWRWDHLTRQWTAPGPLYPGLVLMLRASDGGYNSEVGWTGKDQLTQPVARAGSAAEANDDDPFSENRAWATIAQHTDRVVANATVLLDALKPDLDPWEQVILAAARWHDAGKAHDVFQNALPLDGERQGTHWAKSLLKMKRYDRPGFRHELASALAVLAQGLPDLVAYLVASHHGKVRLSIRSLPHEKNPQDGSDRRFARGVWDGDILPPVDLGGGVLLPEIPIALSYMELGEDEKTGPSWLARMLKLRDAVELGPFRLAFLESLTRVSDWRASSEQAENRGEEVER